MMNRLILAVIGCVGLASAASAQQAQQPASVAAPDYAQDSAWLCLPGRADPCGTPLPTTALNANGYGSVGRSSVAANPAVDCFYVYPTVSRDAGMNSDLAAGPAEEIGATTVQFARFAEVCRTFAPLYRSVTLTALPRALRGEDTAAWFETAYDDVRSAWRQFLASRNRNRPFVLVGHSQGSIHLQRLIREEIEGKPIARRLVSAIIPGWNVEVPHGRAVGGTFRSTPVCTRPAQTGCVVAYSTFRAEAPPPAGALYGRAASPGRTVACVNPARLTGGAAPLDPYFFTVARGQPQPGVAPIAWSREGPPPTLFVRTEGLVTGECVNQGPVGYLAVRVNADPNDARTDRIPGDSYIGGQLNPGWGLHTIDVTIAQGDLIRLVDQQSRAFLRRRRR
jgi:hypothetical protein